MKIICKGCDRCLSLSRQSDKEGLYSACYFRTPFKEISTYDGRYGLHSLPVPDNCEGFTSKKSLEEVLDEFLKKYESK